MKSEIINSSFQNVGILQRLVEKICFANGILENSENKIFLVRDTKFDEAVIQIINDIEKRIIRICEVFVKVFRTDTKVMIYYKIFKILTKIPDNYLINGFPSNLLLQSIQKLSDEEIRQADLTQCLDRLERLQSTRNITPLLVSYNKNLRIVSLMDREFLFYRKYSGVDWDEIVPSIE